MALRVVVSNTSGAPIYDQISTQVQTAILQGDVEAGDLLPSIRALARDLRVSVITTTRAYQELVAAGFVANVPGKGYYVLPRDSELVREQLLRDVEGHLGAAWATARLAGIDRSELHALLDTLIDTPEES
ncbi:GntR family transcriptional regulator [Tessaracoccus bendigoensis DSM 12906]|uniref:GntR family transcriptional regulator n=1 Tax=Tessaracoccus bendigoensis DSM 12906 TaxID=1123357 RepID=A0A1M6BD02_9ACTN|nr:GntR family transcriptional regulator [Tessaracoccus bendigoensis]SHI46333.1 GntR family transcriptional regulator [Tessaracoccus bendigoensis DSM 12906]